MWVHTEPVARSACGWYSCFPNVALLPWEFLANLTWEEDCYTAELHGLEDITNEDAPNFNKDGASSVSGEGGEEVYVVDI